MPIATILALAPQVIKVGSEVWNFIQRIRHTAKQSGEWTPEHEAAFQAKLDDASKQAHWQPDLGQ